MADSKRLQFLKQLTSTLEALTPDGQTEDLTGKVIRGVRTMGQEIDLPYILISQDPDNFANHVSPVMYDSSFRLFLVGATNIDPEHPTDTAENFLAEVKQTIAQAITTDDRLNSVAAIPLAQYDIRDLRIGIGVTYTDKERNDSAMFLLELNMRITEDANDLF